MKRSALACVLFGLLLAACAPKSAPIKNPNTLEASIDRQMGGVGTCVILADAHNGAVLYQYNADRICKAPLPPCATFNVMNSLVALDLGVVTPKTVAKWDRTPQAVRAWQTDADITKAYKNAIDWWFQRAATGVGHDRFAQALRAYGYGNQTVAGPLPLFWQGPRSGGGLAISTRQQADFLQRLYAGKLPVKPETAAFVESLMVNETRGPSVMSSATGSCPAEADGSWTVAWSVGRLKTPNRDLIFAASVEAKEAPSGTAVQQTLKDVFADAGLWPQG